MINKYFLTPLIICVVTFIGFGQRIRTKVVLTDEVQMNRKPYVQVFGDEFDGQTVDTSKWYTFYPYGPATAKDSCGFCRTHVVANVYKDENCMVKSGNLEIVTRADSTSWFGKEMGHTSGMVYSKAVFDTYGRYEIRCKLPEGNRQWPAFWIFGWNTEIDVFEFICKGPEKIEFSIHNWQTNNCANKNPAKGKPCNSSVSGIMDFDVDFSKEFHTFAIEYDAYLIKFFVDDIMVRYVAKYYDINRKPITAGKIKPGRYLLNEAFPPAGEPVSVIANEGVCWPFKKMNSTYPNTMFVDYIRVYQRK